MLGTEKPVQQKIVGDLAGIGWRAIDRPAMNDLRTGRMGEALVEPLLVDALRQLDDDLSETDALQVVEALRRVTDSESFLELLRDGLDIALNPDEPARHVTVVDWQHPERNDYVVTPEFVLETGAVREPRVDVVCLVNGDPARRSSRRRRSTQDWKEAVVDFEGYWVDAPGTRALRRRLPSPPTASAYASRRPGATGASSYAEWKDTWPHERRRPTTRTASWRSASSGCSTRTTSSTSPPTSSFSRPAAA